MQSDRASGLSVTTAGTHHETRQLLAAFPAGGRWKRRKSPCAATRNGAVSISTWRCGEDGRSPKSHGAETCGSHVLDVAQAMGLRAAAVTHACRKLTLLPYDIHGRL